MRNVLYKQLPENLYNIFSLYYVPEGPEDSVVVLTPDGDGIEIFYTSVVIYVGEEYEKFRLSDLGETVRWIFDITGKELTKENREVIESICSSYGVYFYDNGFLSSKVTDINGFVKSVICLCQAILIVTNIFYYKGE